MAHKTLVLSNGVHMPIVGLGVWQAKGGEAYNAVLTALKTGYRHIDTAKIYGNEAEVGRAIRDSGVPREEIFVTTKLWNDDHGDVESAFTRSLRELGLDYVDLYLIHWPVAERVQSWKAFEKIYANGKAKAIGVSNFTVKHLTELLRHAAIKPMVNQVELSPFLSQPELVAFCKENGIVVEAYSPLTRAKKFGDERVVALAHKHGKSPAQVFIRWFIQHEIACIPKSVHEERIKENFSVFDFTLDKEDMRVLDGCNEDFRTCWDPSRIP